MKTDDECIQDVIKIGPASVRADNYIKATIPGDGVETLNRTVIATFSSANPADAREALRVVRSRLGKTPQKGAAFAALRPCEGLPLGFPIVGVVADAEVMA